MPKSNKPHNCDLIEELIIDHGLDLIISTGADVLNDKGFYRLIDYIFDGKPLIPKGERYYRKVIGKHYGIDIYQKISGLSMLIQKNLKKQS